MRILLRDCAGRGHAGRIVTEELSNLARRDPGPGVSAYSRGVGGAARRPRLEDGAHAAFSVISLGKARRKELNYSSDIDLMFSIRGQREHGRRREPHNKEFYKKVREPYTGAALSYTARGMLSCGPPLRPDGTLGEICISAKARGPTTSTRARDWESRC